MRATCSGVGLTESGIGPDDDCSGLGLTSSTGISSAPEARIRRGRRSGRAELERSADRARLRHRADRVRVGRLPLALRARALALGGADDAAVERASLDAGEVAVAGLVRLRPDDDGNDAEHPAERRPASAVMCSCPEIRTKSLRSLITPMRADATSLIRSSATLGSVVPNRVIAPAACPRRGRTRRGEALPRRFQSVFMMTSFGVDCSWLTRRPGPHSGARSRPRLRKTAAAHAANLPERLPWRGQVVMPVTRRARRAGMRSSRMTLGNSRRANKAHSRRLLSELEKPFPAAGAAGRASAEMRRASIPSSFFARSTVGHECPFASAPRRRSATGTAPPTSSPEGSPWRPRARSGHPSGRRSDPSSRIGDADMDERGLRLLLGRCVGEDDDLAQLEESDAPSSASSPRRRRRAARRSRDACRRSGSSAPSRVAARARDPNRMSVSERRFRWTTASDEKRRLAAKCASGSSTRRISASRCASIFALRNELIGSSTTSAISFSTTISSRSPYSSGIVMLRA